MPSLAGGSVCYEQIKQTMKIEVLQNDLKMLAWMLSSFHPRQPAFPVLFAFLCPNDPLGLALLLYFLR